MVLFDCTAVGEVEDDEATGLDLFGVYEPIFGTEIFGGL